MLKNIYVKKASNREYCDRVFVRKTGWLLVALASLHYFRISHVVTVLKGKQKFRLYCECLQVILSNKKKLSQCSICAVWVAAAVFSIFKSYYKISGSFSISIYISITKSAQHFPCIWMLTPNSQAGDRTRASLV